MKEKEAEKAVRVLFYCVLLPSYSTIYNGNAHDTISPWIFAASASIILPVAGLLNTLVIITLKKRESCGNFPISCYRVCPLRNF